MHHNAYLGPTACSLSFAECALLPSVELLSESFKQRKTRKRGGAERAVAQGFFNNPCAVLQYCKSSSAESLTDPRKQWAGILRRSEVANTG